MESLTTIATITIILSFLCLLAYWRSKRKSVWHKRASVAFAALAAFLLMLFLGVMPRVAAYRGCTAYVVEGGAYHVESRCPQM